MVIYFEKNVLLKINFQDEGHLDANFWIYILTIYSECFLFQFFNCDIHMHIAIRTGVQNGCIIHRKNSHILLRNVLFEAYLRDKAHIYANCLFYILSLCLKCLHFQISTRGIRKHVSIRTGLKNGHISG